MIAQLRGTHEWNLDVWNDIREALGFERRNVAGVKTFGDDPYLNALDCTPSILERLR